MAAALFPKLREIDIHSNPLTTNRSGNVPTYCKRQLLYISTEYWKLRSPRRPRVNPGDPPLLTHYLQKRLGIAIQRHKAPSQPQRKV